MSRGRDISRPLDQVLGGAWQDFTPAHPERPPWHRPQLGRVELAYTDDVVTVPLEIADRVRLHGLDRPSWEVDDMLFEDQLPASWGVS